jgi:small subunit ribosomal protein S8e
MAIWHGEAKRKPSGGKTRKHSKKKRKYELGNLPVFTKIGKNILKKVRTKGGNLKLKLFSVEYANVYNPKTKKVQKVKILDILENPANPHFVRRKIITKGSIVQTEIGKAKVVSRPGQHGIINAILVEG